MTRLLQDWVVEQAQRRPEATAVVSTAARLTYGELDTLSSQLARVLKEAGCQRFDRVALLLPSSPMAIAGLLGIYKAGGIYVPLDAASPVARLKKILDSCENQWLLAAAPVTPVVQELFEDEEYRQRLRVGWLDHAAPVGDGFRADFTLDDVRRAPAAPIDCRRDSDVPAHILFTSGSTGMPKGVVLSHANVIHFIEWAVGYFGIESSDRAPALPPLHFDMSMLDIFSMMAAGGELHLIPKELHLLPQKLAEFIRTAQLTQLYVVPAILNLLAKFNAVRQNDFPAMRRVIWAGDVLPTPALIYWMQRLPHVSFTNLYGPTETAISSSYYTVPECPRDPQAAIPIGVGCAGEELLVLDESLRPAATGEIGDLYIGGVGVALGYWRDAERTAQSFLRDPRNPSQRLYKTGDLARVGDNGQVYFLGRKDFQVKSRGYRIELGEIETAVNAIDGILECAVVGVRTGGFEGVAICCAYVTQPGEKMTPSAIRRALSRAVPPYMLPTRWQAFDVFPKNASGKIDRRRLQDIFAGSVDTRAAQTA
ncbi:MAG TPA: amino acid adenylation domain-containing protein [Vicinamibacterales bacterium]|nr:amino acid adenylation domain-containing protein [Vicinamibacterales bacterium]